jgi:acetyl-CoA C-acetyltransferase
MGTIRDRVAIVGMGCIRFGELWDKSPEDMMVEACFEAFEDAGIEPKDIEAAWLGTVTGGLLGMRLARALKFDYIPVTHVENLCGTAADTFRNACFAVAAGIYDVVLAVGFEKLKDTGMPALLSSKEPEYRSKVETDVIPPAYYAPLATRYFHRYGISLEEGRRLLSMIAVKNHHNGSLNPKAHFQREITLEQALKAPMISPPLALFDCCGVSDGAAAAIITRADLAKNFRDDFILVKALRLVTGAFQGELRQDYDFTHIEENVRAAQAAYEEAGIKDPRKEIDLAIVHDCFTIHEMVLYEDLGFSPRGKAREDIEAGTFTLEGELPVNTDGGLKCFGHPLGASGLRMIYEVYKQLQGKAGARQVKDANIGLTHNLGGDPHSGVGCICILGKRD